MSNNNNRFKTNVFNKFLNNNGIVETTNEANNLRCSSTNASDGINLTSSLSVLSSVASAAFAAFSSSFRLNNINFSNNNDSSNESGQLSSTSTLSFKMERNFSSTSIDVLPMTSNVGATASVTSALVTNPTKIDKKLFEKLNKFAEKILKYCQSERMNLINSPPYIIDILPDICQVLNTIQITYENKFHVLNDIEYFSLLCKNCMEKFSKILDLFKQSGKRIYDETSEERTKLTKLTLILSHILAEMKSLFPKDVYEGQSFRIAKQDAAEFWKLNFKERVIVGWDEFERKLNKVHNITSRSESLKLKETIQLTETNCVSIFEFDIFTRLFQPWGNLLNNWKFLVTEHPGYCAFSTYDEVHKRLQKFINKPGSYLFRLSCTKLGQWAIGYVTSDNKILQTIPQSLVQALIDGQKQNLYLYPNGSNDVAIDIAVAISATSASRIQISKEQYDMYCDMGTSFQLCKICSENNKDRKLEPCGHLICSLCLENWQEQNSTCPFCRCEIKTFEPIICCPFDNRKVSVLKKPPKDSTEHLSLMNGANDEYLLPEKSSSINLSKLNNPTLNGSASHLLNKFQEKNKNFNALNSQSEEDYLIPTNDPVIQTEKIEAQNSFSNGAYLTDLNGSDGFKVKPNSINNNASRSNLNEEIFNGSRSNLAINNNSIPQPPVFPPPLPPPLFSNLLPPTSPPPLPPSQQHISQQSNSIVQLKNSIIKLQDCSKEELILKIENNSLLEQLSETYGCEKSKLAAALFLTNNDVKQAIDIFLKYK